jgi:2-deoxy-D-gluconate 3-dehydrogenase
MTTDDVFSINGKRAIVTGGAMGIGFGIAERFAAGGASVLLADLDEDAAVAAASKLAGLPGRIHPLRIDVAADDAGGLAIEACVREFGGIDVLVNNAGIFPMSPVLDMTPEFFDRIVAVNLRGTVFMARAAAAQMTRQGEGGSIINIASIDALHPSMVGLGAYDTSKGGVLMFTRALALELAPHGIRVNAIAPGGINTEGASKPLEGSDMTADQMREMTEAFLRMIPLGRMGAPDDIAKVAVFLASEGSAYMTGTMLVVDGGRLLS